MLILSSATPYNDPAPLAIYSHSRAPRVLMIFSHDHLARLAIAVDVCSMKTKKNDTESDLRERGYSVIINTAHGLKVVSIKMRRSASVGHSLITEPIERGSAFRYRYRLGVV